MTGSVTRSCEIAIDNVFGRLWGREGLSRRDRSLVTLGILIALRSNDELGIHFKIARNNGLTDDEIAEVIYHSSGYAGFPAANTACKIAARGSDAKPTSVRELAEKLRRVARRHARSRKLWSHLGESNP